MAGRGCKSGSKNFRRLLLKELVVEILPNGNSCYQRCTGKSELRNGQNIQKCWQFKMCNIYKKPTGSTDGAGKDFILECIETAQK
jgi:hypothetical protein